jgi:type I restriction enzyme S subunit
MLVGERHSDYQLLSLTKGGVIVRDVSTGRGKFSADMGTSQEVRVGDLIFCLFDVPETPRTVGLSKYDGMITGAYTVFECRDTQLARFLEAFYIAMDDRKLLSPLYSGLRKTIPPSVFLGVKTPLPPLPEQAAIVRFLDHVDRRIRRYIRAKQKLIKLLEEQKQAIIHRAVTRGLDPNVRLKPSGVEWLGDVPEHCEVEALRRRWRVTDCKHLTVPFVEDGIPLASVREAQRFDLSFETSNRTTREWYEKLIEGDRKPMPGDLIYCRNVSVGAATLVTRDEPFAMGQDVCLIRSFSENQRWLNYFLHSKAMTDQLALILVGSTFNRINVADIKALTIVVPRRRDQDRIADFLDNEVQGIDVTIGTCRKEQALIREYRTRLITDVVTGKVDVRDAAARLLDEVEELDAVDEIDIDSALHVDAADDIDAISEEAEA